MPIHNLGYREWQGTLRTPSSRWLVIAEIGIRRAWQSAWLRRMMFFAWVPGIVMGFMIFLYEQSAEQGGEVQDLVSAGAMVAVYLVLMMLLPYAPAERGGVPIGKVPAKTREWVEFLRSKFNAVTN